MSSDGDTDTRRWNPFVAALPVFGIAMGVWVLIAVSRYPWNDLQATYASLLGWATLVGSCILTGAAFRMRHVAVRVFVSLLSIGAISVGVLGLTFVQESESDEIPCIAVTPGPKGGLHHPDEGTPDYDSEPVCLIRADLVSPSLD